MGLAASQARILALTARRSDLELQGQTINSNRISLSNQISQAMQQQAQMTNGFDDNNPNKKRIESYIAQVQQKDKTLELQLRTVDTQRQAVDTQIQAVEKVISNNIQRSFKLVGGQ